MLLIRNQMKAFKNTLLLVLVAQAIVGCRGQEKNDKRSDFMKQCISFRTNDKIHSVVFKQGQVVITRSFLAPTRFESFYVCLNEPRCEDKLESWHLGPDTTGRFVRLVSPSSLPTPTMVKRVDKTEPLLARGNAFHATIKECVAYE